MRDSLLGKARGLLRDGPMTSNLVLLAATGLVFAFLVGGILGYALRSYISRRRRRRRSQRYDLSAALSPPHEASDASEDIIPLAPVLDGGLTSPSRGGANTGPRKIAKQRHQI